MKLLHALFAALFDRSAASQSPGLVLGKSMAGAAVMLRDADVRDHMLVAGRTGVGVRRFSEELLVQQTMQNKGWIHIDPFADNGLLQRLSAAAVMAGRTDEFLVLDLDVLERSHTYDLLRTGSPAERAVRVLQVLPDVANSPGAAFYADLSFAVLKALFALVDASGRSVGISELSDILTQINKPCIQQALLALVPDGHPARTAFEEVLSPLQREGVDAEQRVRAVRVVGARLQLLVGVQAEALMNAAAPQICFADVLSQNKMCLVRLPSMLKDTVPLQLAKMMLHDISTSLEARQSNPARTRTPFLVVMDSIGAYLDGVANSRFAAITSNTYARARAMNVGLVAVATGDTPVPGAAPDGDIVWANTGTKVFFNQAADRVSTSGIIDPRVADLGLGQFEKVSRTEQPVFAEMLPFDDAAHPAGDWLPHPCAAMEPKPRLTLKKEAA